MLEVLKTIAPVYAIRGNIDRGPWAKKLPDILNLQIIGAKIHVIHNVHEIDGEPNAAGMHVVISGQSHKPSNFTRDNVLSVDPGSAGPRRFKLPVTVAQLNIQHKGLCSEIVEVL